MTIEEIRDFIQENTDGLFKCFVFDNKYDFEASGISDNYINQFYLRPVMQGPTKYRVSTDENGITNSTAKYRLIVQVAKKYDNVLNTFLNILLQVDSIRLTSYSNDTDGIYKAEHGKDVALRTHDLYLFDFDHTEQMIFRDIICECITEKEC